MSDPVTSALGELADLDTDRLGVRPAPAVELRARGDRHRRRRYAAQSLAAAVAVAAVGIGAATLGSPGTSEPEPAPLPSGTPSPEATDETSPSPTVDPTPEDTQSAGTLVIPATFPLAASYPETNEDTTPVKVSARPGFGGLTLCGETVLTSAGAADVAGAKFVGAEDYRSRTLLLFENAADALAVIQQARQVVGACPTFDNSRFTQWAVPLGDESFAFDQTYDDSEGGFALGLSSYVVVQVGRAVLIGTAYGEAGGRNEAFNQSLVDDARDVVAAMADLP